MLKKILFFLVTASFLCIALFIGFYLYIALTDDYDGMFISKITFFQNGVCEEILAFKDSRGHLPKDLSEASIKDFITYRNQKYPIYYQIFNQEKDFHLMSDWGNSVFYTVSNLDEVASSEATLVHSEHCATGMAGKEKKDKFSLPVYKQDLTIFAQPDTWPTF